MSAFSGRGEAVYNSQYHSILKHGGMAQPRPITLSSSKRTIKMIMNGFEQTSVAFRKFVDSPKVIGWLPPGCLQI